MPISSGRGLLERQGIMVVGVASTSAEALQQAAELRPDVTVLDIDLGGESGFDHQACSLAGLPGLLPVNSTRPTFQVLPHVGLVEFTGRGTNTRLTITLEPTQTPQLTRS